MKVVSAGLGLGYIRIADSITHQRNLPRPSDLDVRTFKKVFNRTIKEIKEEQANLSEEDNDRYLLLDMQLLMLENPTVIKRMEFLMEEANLNSLEAYTKASNELIERMNRSEDSAIRKQKEDYEDALEKLMMNMFIEPTALADIDYPIILVCETLTFQQIAKVSRRYLKGIILRHVSAHTPIKIASAMGIPVVECDDIEKFSEGECLYLYADRSSASVKQGDLSKIDYESQNKSFFAEKWRGLNPTTQLAGMAGIDAGIDNTYFKVHATIDSFQDLKDVRFFNAKEIGLYRTELFYAKQELIPTEEMLYEEYKAIFDELEEPLIRTFDFGRDKTVDYLKNVKRNNQGLKYALHDKGLFKIQLRAILSASSEKSLIKIIFPFVTSLDDVIKAGQVIDSVQRELAKEEIPYQKNVYKGAMVETIEMAMDFDKYIEHLDFFFIGTTDLLRSYKEYSYETIYDMMQTMGIPMNGLDHNTLKYEHPQYHDIFDILENHGYPVDNQSIDFLFLHLIITIVDKIKANNMIVNVCGDMADNPFYTIFFMWLDVDYISVAPNLIEATSRMSKIMSQFNYPDYYTMIFNKS